MLLLILLPIAPAAAPSTRATNFGKAVVVRGVEPRHCVRGPFHPCRLTGAISVIEASFRLVPLTFRRLSPSVDFRPIAPRYRSAPTVCRPGVGALALFGCRSLNFLFPTELHIGGGGVRVAERRGSSEARPNQCNEHSRTSVKGPIQLSKRQIFPRARPPRGPRPPSGGAVSHAARTGGGDLVKSCAEPPGRTADEGSRRSGGGRSEEAARRNTAETRPESAGEAKLEKRKGVKNPKTLTHTTRPPPDSPKNERRVTTRHGPKWLRSE